MKKALICGVSGQDGAYLTALLLEKGYEIYGGSRDATTNPFDNLRKLGLLNHIRPVSINTIDFKSTLATLSRIKPDEVYHLSGQSSVGLSFEQPVETYESISIGTLNLLEAMRFTGLPVRMYHAGSSECFGETDERPADENTPFRPRSPYAIAKASAHWQVINYREAYELYACSGIMFNHESPFRPHRFVTRKIVSTACRIYKGSNEKLNLGNLQIRRDWGWAPEYVEAMWRMLQQEQPQDFVIATGETNSLENFTDKVFSYLQLNWQDHVVIDTELFRPADLFNGNANPSKAAQVLGWKAGYRLDDIVKGMMDAELK